MSFAEHFVFCAFSRLIALRAASRSPSPSVFTPSAAMSLADLVTVINDLSAASQFNQLLTHLQSQEEMMIQQLPQLDEALASQIEKRKAQSLNICLLFRYYRNEG